MEQAAKRISVKDVEAMIKGLQVSEYPQAAKRLREDGRAALAKLADKLERQEEKYRQELLRTKQMCLLENQLYEKGFASIAGTDEVGRGPLAGPVLSAAVIMPKDHPILYVNDSKQLSEKKRESLYEEITREAVSVGIGIVDHKTIDKINILNATKLSMKQAFEALSPAPDILLLDAMTIDAPVRQRSIVKGDATVYSIAAASIVAKVTRDRMMEEMDFLYPQYGFAGNKGYGSSAHLEALRKYGPCEIHRRTFLSGILRPSSQETGRLYEQRAAEYLKAQGYALIARNYRCRGGEIDLIARDGETYVFCEVKARARGEWGRPEDMVDREKQRRIVQTAESFLAQRAVFAPGRFDVLAYEIMEDGSFQMRHYKDAFSLN